MKGCVRTRRTGMTLVLVTTIGVIVGILGLSMVELGYQARILSVRSVQGISARTAADAGLADGLFWMQQKLVSAVWSDTGFPRTITGTLPGAQAQYRYTISVLAPSSRYQIDSTGTLGPVARTVHASLRLGFRSKGFNGGKADIGSSTFNGEIRTNSITSNAITLEPGVTVNGDIMCGPGGNPNTVIDLKPRASDTDSYAASDLMVFPPVSAPSSTYVIAIPKSGTTINQSPPSPSQVYQCPSINLNNGATLQISNVHVILYVAGDMTMKNGSAVSFSNGGSLTLYLKGSLTADQGADLSNAANDPSELEIYGLPGCSIKLDNSSIIDALIYAPSADVILDNSSKFCGAIVANSLTTKNQGIFQCDARATHVTIDDAAAVFEIERWWED